VGDPHPARKPARRVKPAGSAKAAAKSCSALCPRPWVARWTSRWPDYEAVKPEWSRYFVPADHYHDLKTTLA